MEKHSSIGLPDEYRRSCYILVLELQEETSVDLRLGRRKLTLGPGVYLYVGSAKGACDVFCRVLRHLSPWKRLHWHIDQLTSNTRVLKHGFFIIKNNHGDCEAALSSILRRIFDYINGFGCSDKPGDVSHLYICRGTLEECIIQVYRVLDDFRFEPIWIQVELLLEA